MSEAHRIGWGPDMKICYCTDGQHVFEVADIHLSPWTPQQAKQDGWEWVPLLSLNPSELPERSR